MNDPYIATLTISVISRRAIDQARFDGKPLDFDLGAAVLGEVETRYLVGNKPALDAGEWPDYSIDGGKLRLGPANLHKDSELITTLLLDGEPKLRPVLRTVPNVNPIRGRRHPSQKFALTARLTSRALEAGFLLLAAGLTLNATNPYDGDSPPVMAAAALTVGVFILAVAAASAAKELHRRRALRRPSSQAPGQDIPAGTDTLAIPEQPSEEPWWIEALVARRPGREPASGGAPRSVPLRREQATTRSRTGRQLPRQRDRAGWGASCLSR
ncbi:hypothetical protein [Streptacidiphilus anmyonensis]|uniref:hypothetical protein n=1 Tax=Streptacidiphilus anmyonensis TaxID=405782 RepID=UPI0005A5FB02|nr:hypothetical protein [Streptacidiphilus anmyonensis]